jgi:hypothetical protein
MIRRRALVSARATLLAWVVLAAVAHPALAGVGTTVGGSFSITPARRYVVARPPVRLAPTRVANTTSSALLVRVVPVLLSQLPSGAFSFDASAPGLQATRPVLRVSPSAFEPAPGASREVSLRWLGLPSRSRAANVGVIYQAVPTLGSTPVRVVEQLLAVNILRLPGHYRRSGRLIGVHVTQFRPKVLRFALDARNTGQAVAGPSRMVLTVHDRTGARLLRRVLTGDIVLPGATREFTIDVKHPLPAGAYTAIGHLAFGSSHRLTARSSFQLAGPNELPTSQLQVGTLIAKGTVGKSAEVTATLRNTGTAAGTLGIALDLYRLQNGVPGPRPVATRRLITGSLGPGNSSRLQNGFGRLQRGTYRLAANYEAADGTPQTLVADFQAEQPLGLFTRLRDVSREHALLIPGLLILLILLGGTLLVGMLIHARRLRRGLESAYQEIAELKLR